jgi:Holliday junction resolvase RusA-like endonuclease
VAFTVPGVPVPKARPRYAQGVVYTPARTRDFEDLVRGCAIDAKRRAGMADGDLLKGPLSVRIWFLLGGADPFTVVEVSEVEGGPPPKHADVDNLAKSILDGMQHGVAPILIRDDNDVVRLSVEVLRGG